MAKGKAATSRLVLTLPEYERIYKIVNSVLEGRANTPHACMFFAIAGAVILSKHYRIAAQPVAGAFFMCVDPAPLGIAMAKNQEGLIDSDRENFHMWIQTTSHVIDFMSPIFNESVKDVSADTNIPRKMFQRRAVDEAPSVGVLLQPGDFYTVPNPALTEDLIESFFSRPSHTDLLEACDRWFKKHPKKLDDMSLLDDLGEVHRLVLAAPPISGAW